VLFGVDVGFFEWGQPGVCVGVGGAGRGGPRDPTKVGGGGGGGGEAPRKTTNGTEKCIKHAYVSCITKLSVSGYVLHH